LHKEIKIIINLNLKKMRKGILCLAAVALLAVFSTSCNPDVIITAPESIEIELGSTDADVLKDVTASSKDEVTVTGVNYDHAGEQTATFAAGDATLDKVVHVKTTKLAGTYEFTWSIDGQADPRVFDSDIQQSTTVYNKILISDIIDGNVSAVCTGTNFTIEETSLEADGGVTGTLTGTGTFVKDGTNYKIATASITVAWSDNVTNEIEVTFSKQ
jgi:hypothetical protein